jgi:predicted ribosome quality control (RQC) complex YloA/Tae2 family protein
LGFVTNARLLPLIFPAPIVNNQTINAIVDEITPALVGGNIGKIFQLSRFSLAMDFRRRDGRYLVLGVDPQPEPRIYLIARRVRDLEKQSVSDSSFVTTLIKRISGARLVAISKDDGDRIVRFSFAARDIVGATLTYTLIAQLTGRTASLLLLDENEYVIDSLRASRGAGIEVAEKYAPPVLSGDRSNSEPALERGSFPSLSDAADAYYHQLDADRKFTVRIATARARLKKEIGRRVKLQQHLQADLETHGDADTHKRFGELLIANVGTAERKGEIVIVTDYFAEGTPRIELQLDENTSLQEEAARRFARYTKARRAAIEIARRLEEIEIELQALNIRLADLQNIATDRDETRFASEFGEDPKQSRTKISRKGDTQIVPGTRRYLSSDGFEILVGREARDNDQLTFRVARPYDLWLHASDYPGSHVIVLNPTRKDIPHRTVIEAAQLAAKFSKARRDGKVDVNYTQRKFLSKPKGAAPGLVRMSSFKTIVVEPLDNVERI